MKTASGVTRYFLYDGGQPVIEETWNGSTATVIALNGFVADGWCTRYEPSIATAYDYLYDPQGNLVQRQSAYDYAHGRPAYDQTIYEGYGALRSDTQIVNAAGGGSPTTPRDPVGFGGQYGYYTDTETGLLCLTHRYYDPETGRFVNRDPIGYDGGVNLYGFAGGNPVNMSDPSGLDAGDWVDKYLLGGAISNLGDTAGRYDSGRATKGELVRASISSGVQVTLLAVSIVDGAAAVRAAPQLLARAATKIPQVVARTNKISYVPMAFRKLGGTDFFGNIRINTRLLAKGFEDILDETIRHESVHSFLSGRSLAAARFKYVLTQGSPLYLYLEEAIAEANATRNIINGMRFPIDNGYVTLESVIRDGNKLVVGGRAIYNSTR